jgi:prevent-host-death family protein
MKRIGIYQAKTHLAQLCEEVARTGEACLISKNGKPLVKIVPIRDEGGPDSVWDTVEESRGKYGPLVDFELPERDPLKDMDASCLDEPTT